MGITFYELNFHIHQYFLRFDSLALLPFKNPKLKFRIYVYVYICIYSQLWLITAKWKIRGTWFFHWYWLDLMLNIVYTRLTSKIMSGRWRSSDVKMPFLNKSGAKEFLVWIMKMFIDFLKLGRMRSDPTSRLIKWYNNLFTLFVSKILINYWHSHSDPISILIVCMKKYD